MNMVTETQERPSAQATVEAGDRRSDIVAAIFRALDAANIRYCVPHGHESLPDGVFSDVDLIIDGAALPHRLAQVLQSPEIGASIVQWLDDRAHFIVLADTSEAGSLHLLQLHVTPDFEQANRVYYTGTEMLDSRFLRNGIWIPSAEIEFGCILCNRVAKGNLGDDRARRLSELYAQSPLACEQQATRFFSASSALAICLAAESEDWSTVKNAIPQLKAELMAFTARTDRAGMIRRSAAAWGRRIKRWIAPPCGLHVVFLGPDGVGKSTVIAGVQEDLSPAFLKTEYHTFAPSLLPAKMQQKPSPHALPPRGKLASLYKAGWWFVCYTLGYMASIHPARARSAFVLNHRYLLDAIVDPKRYRYSGPKFLLKWIAIIAPKADLVILLNAPPEVIQSRKQEVPFAETARQCSEYRSIVEKLPNGCIVDATLPVHETIAAVDRAVLAIMRARITRRFPKRISVQ